MGSRPQEVQRVNRLGRFGQETTQCGTDHDGQVVTTHSRESSTISGGE